jgi:hypothetical protein
MDVPGTAGRNVTISTPTDANIPKKIKNVA